MFVLFLLRDGRALQSWLWFHISVFGFESVPCLPSVEFRVVRLLCNWIHSPPFAVDICILRNYLQFWGSVCCCWLLFFFLDIWFQCFLWERVCGGEIASHPACLCISVYLDSPLSCSPPPKKKNLWLAENKTRALLGNAWKVEEGKASQSWKLFLAEMGCCVLGNSSSWARLLLFDCLKKTKREMTAKGEWHLPFTPVYYPIVVGLQTVLYGRLRHLKSSFTGEKRLEWVSPAPVLARGEGCRQSRARTLGSSSSSWVLLCIGCAEPASPSLTPALSLLSGWKTWVVTFCKDAQPYKWEWEPPSCIWW